MDISFDRERSSLEEAFFRKRDAELIAEMRRREQMETRKKALSEVSGITDETVLDQLVAHDIHAEALAAFSLVPLIEVAWSDGEVQPGERAVLLKVIAEAGIPKEGVAYRMMEQWLKYRPEAKVMEVWTNYTRALMGVLTADAAEEIKTTILGHARTIAEAAGGFLGFGRTSSQEEKVLQQLEKAFESGKEA